MKTACSNRILHSLAPARFTQVVLALVLGLGVGTARGQEPAPLPVAIAPADGNLRYVGRFDHSDAAGPRCAWSASTVIVRFRGTALNALLAGKGEDFWQVYLDGQPTEVIQLKEGQTRYEVATNLSAGEHQVELAKRTEFNVGFTQILGFQLSADGALLPAPPAPDRRIEVIGDSISCGYGNEAPTKEEKFTPLRENACIAYGALAARDLGADYVCVAWSGKKLWPNNSILDFYERILPESAGASAPWDFAAYTPQAVIINLGTNDYGVADPDGPGWEAAYRALIQRLRKQYPDAWIYPTLGTMLGDWPAPRKPASTIRQCLTGLVAECQAAGDSRVRFIDFGTQLPADGFGGSWHPSAATHRKMAAKLTRTLKQDLKW